ncbi:alpha/beta hydrolase [Runella slithyformis]|uniref:Monoacylglycerol lipase n=1 Tax=Runella slithyformis (strain ATCC 29530 / DSM 19594 / LMG 11500 / NCIMB 11436 / LSU 4) TaxID=761193 RepID=A0A7U3ZI13_RUNSL|nr:alpha/beta hydrolase [Runella slithyformis]AEI47607.1 alpha/beta hydrolase fold protein [Runella slithyformis DSM 19594]
MSEITQTLIAKDGLTLFTRARPIAQPKAVIAFIHGFGEHSGRYAHVANFFNKNGYSFYSLDNRGHGRSEGKRGHAPGYTSYLDDIEVFLEFIASQTNSAPVFLYGHSMGGNLVMNYVLRRKPMLKGLIVSGPWIQLAFEPKPIMIALGKMMRSIYPGFSQDSGLVQEHISKDPAVVEAYKNDPLVHGLITASAGMGAREAAELLNKYTGEMPVPTLMMHAADDKLTSQPASEAFAQRVSGPVTYKKWEGMYHEIHNEPQQLEVLNYILGWMERSA